MQRIHRVHGLAINSSSPTPPQSYALDSPPESKRIAQVVPCAANDHWYHSRRHGIVTFFEPHRLSWHLVRVEARIAVTTTVIAWCKSSNDPRRGRLSPSGGIFLSQRGPTTMLVFTRVALSDKFSQGITPQGLPADLLRPRMPLPWTWPKSCQKDLRQRNQPQHRD